MHVDRSPFITGQRRILVDELRSKGVTERWVLAAVAAVAREPFCASSKTSSPYLVGLMTQALEIETGDRVLEVGTGSGYSAAVLSMLAGQVLTVEKDPARAAAARTRLDALGYRRIVVNCADGTLGWPEHAPFSRIVVRATGRVVPQALRDQLDVGGRLVMPLLIDDAEVLTRTTRTDHVHFAFEALCAVRCSPLIGECYWADRDLAPDTD